MANQYNLIPAQISATMASGWRELQTLNTANLPSTAQQLSGTVLAQPGVRVYKIVWTGRTASQTNTFVIQDPKSSTNLFQGSSIDGANPADIEYDWESAPANWRDWVVTTITSGTLLLYFRT